MADDVSITLVAWGKCLFVMSFLLFGILIKLRTREVNEQGGRRGILITRRRKGDRNIGLNSHLYGLVRYLWRENAAIVDSRMPM